ncbi:MAG: hypothetical protein INF91_03595 [Alphaproteobacteria bacterium]|nr:hypothetical protein [Alphaproteobacteria bacterium]
MRRGFPPTRPPAGWLSQALRIEARARETLAILDAIRDSRLLVMPSAAADRERHRQAVALLDMVGMNLREVLQPPDRGPDERRRA